jgi:shikimate 5-dehydrogenase
MKQFVSFSKYPSNNGKYFYTNFFKLHNINADYNPLAATEDNILDMIKHAASQKVVGISISMPFKQKVLAILDYAETDVIKYNSCNTIVVVDNKLHGYNTDIEGVIRTSTKIQSKSVAILGDGSMANMYSKYLSNSDITINMYSRRLQNWDDRHDDNAEVVINCTGIGTVDDESPLLSLKNKKLVIDLAIKKKKLYEQCLTNSVEYISGSVFYKHQFLKQFMLYTGVLVNELEFDKIEAEKNDY